MIELYCPEVAMRLTLEEQLRRLGKDFTNVDTGDSYPTYKIKKHGKTKKTIRGKFDDPQLAKLLM